MPVEGFDDVVTQQHETSGDDDGMPARMQLLGDMLSAEAFGRVCRHFLSATPDLMAALGAAACAGDPDSVFALAHKLKGTMGTFGALRLTSLADTLSAASTAGSTAGIDDLLSQMDDEYRRVRGLVSSFMPPDGGP